MPARREWVDRHKGAGVGKPPKNEPAGFRMPARREWVDRHKGAGVGKPPKNEPAGKR